MNDYKLGFLFLGAGSSSRMLGDDKLLKKVNGVTQIQKILNEIKKEKRSEFKFCNVK